MLRERPFEIFGYALTIFIIFVYIVVNYIVEGEEGDIAKLVRVAEEGEGKGWRVGWGIGE